MKTNPITVYNDEVNCCVGQPQIQFQKTSYTYSYKTPDGKWDVSTHVDLHTKPIQNNSVNG
ncbi:hypothetical protein [Flavobacterium sp.]|uniref:hypothetical protein n=1 Tax=Flavobacterium sp. TaxID=239 RepID=UPI0037C18CD8